MEPKVKTRAQGPGQSYIVPAVKRAFEIIDLLASTGGGMTSTEIQRQLRFPLSSVATILYTLDKLGYVDRENGDSRYRLRLRLPTFSSKALEPLHPAGL